MFRYLKFNKKGEKVVASTTGLGKEMLMDISVYKLKSGHSKSFFSQNKEMAILLVNGKIRIMTEGVDEQAQRDDLFTDLPTCLHVSKQNKVQIVAITDCEFIYQATENDRSFATKLYRKSDVIQTVSSEGMWENTAVRDVNTIFDYDNAPYSNMVIGEVLARQGRWWSYVPHSHPQPEVYYYKFARPEGFGACFINDKAHTVKEGSAGYFTSGNTHSQVTAPGYPMYCCWMIRHLDGDPWLKTRVVHPDFVWLDDNPKFVKK